MAIWSAGRITSAAHCPNGSLSVSTRPLPPFFPPFFWEKTGGRPARTTTALTQFWRLLFGPGRVPVLLLVLIMARRQLHLSAPGPYWSGAPLRRRCHPATSAETKGCYFAIIKTQERAANTLGAKQKIWACLRAESQAHRRGPFPPKKRRGERGEPEKGDLFDSLPTPSWARCLGSIRQPIAQWRRIASTSFTSCCPASERRARVAGRFCTAMSSAKLSAITSSGWMM